MNGESFCGLPEIGRFCGRRSALENRMCVQMSTVSEEHRVCGGLVDVQDREGVLLIVSSHVCSLHA